MSRRQEICFVAEGMFYQRGYSATTLKDVTDVLGLTAPAIYRHFSSKQDLLLAVLESALDAVDEALAPDKVVPMSPDDAVRQLATIAVARPDVWELAERDARHLEPADQARIGDRIRSIGRWLRTKIAQTRPELAPESTALLARAVLALFTMPSAYAAKLPTDELIELLVRAALRAIAIPEAELRPPRMLDAPDFTTIDPTSRREHVLREAGRLFSERGYEDVSMGDIGDAVGMTGPSIYHYFDGKADILTSIFRRGLEWLAIDRARHAQADEAGTLTVLLESYARLALSWREIFRLFVHEQVILQHIDQGSVVRAYRDVVQGGVVLLRACRPDLGPTQARALLGCAMSVINDLAITDTSRDQREVATALVAVATSMLELDLPVS